MRQKVTSLWQSDVQTIFILTSQAWGGATSTSSITSGSPPALLTAAESSPPRKQTKLITLSPKLKREPDKKRSSVKLPLHLIDLPAVTLLSIASRKNSITPQLALAGVVTLVIYPVLSLVFIIYIYYLYRD